jgi:hypothetical protein
VENILKLLPGPVKARMAARWSGGNTISFQDSGTTTTAPTSSIRFPLVGADRSEEPLVEAPLADRSGFGEPPQPTCTKATTTATNKYRDLCAWL